MKKIFVFLLAVAVLVPTIAFIGLAQPKCIPNCSENPKVMDREPLEAAAEFKGGTVQAGGLKPFDLEPNQEETFGLPSGTKTVVITAGEGDLTYTLTKVVGTGARAQRTKITDGAVAAKQSVTVNVPAFDRAKQEAMELTVTAGTKKTSVSLVFQGAPADETVLPRVAVELAISNQGPDVITYVVKDALNRTVKNAGKDVQGSVNRGETVIVGIEESLGPNRVLQISAAVAFAVIATDKADIDYEVDGTKGTVAAGKSAEVAVKPGQTVKVTAKGDTKVTLTFLDANKQVLGKPVEKALKGGESHSETAQKGDAKVDVKIYYEQIPQPAELYKGIYATTSIARPRTLNPVTATDTASTLITDRLNDTLLDGPVGAETGAIAEAFEVTPDRKTATYTLRKGVKFSDGTPITSEDVRFTFENLIYPKDIATSTRDVLYCAGGQDLPKVKVIDERKVSFTCDKPANDVPHPTVGFIEILSKKSILKLAPNVEKSPKDFNNVYGVNTKPEDIVGAGPFKLSKIDPNTVVEFVRNPYTFRVDEKSNQLPYIAGIRIILAPTQGQELALQQFRNGQTDFINPRPADIAILQSDKASGRLPINDDIDSGNTGFGTEFWVVSWTAKNPTLRAAFANKQVRFAFSHASDRASMVKNIRLGLGTEIYSQVSVPSPYHIERPGQNAAVLARWEQAKKRFDLKKAAEILDSLGIKDVNGDGIRDIPANFANDFGPQTNPAGPFKFELNTNVGNTLREEMIKLLASDLKKIGVEVTAVPKDFAALVDQLTIGDYEGIMIGLTGGSAAASGINVYTCDGNLHFWNVDAGPGCAKATEDEKKLDALYRQLADETDEAKLRQLADEAQFVFANHLPYIPLTVGNALAAFRTDTIRNHARNPLGSLQQQFIFCKGGRCRGG